MEFYVAGVSTRKVDALVAALGSQSGISKSQVTRICTDIDVQVQAFLSRPLDTSGYASCTSMTPTSTAGHGYLKVNSGSIFSKLNSPERKHSFDVVGQLA